MIIEKMQKVSNIFIMRERERDFLNCAMLKEFKGGNNCGLKKRIDFKFKLVIKILKEGIF